MKFEKNQVLKKGELIVKVTGSSGGEKDIIVRSKHETMRLSGLEYAIRRSLQSSRPACRRTFGSRAF